MAQVMVVTWRHQAITGTNVNINEFLSTHATGQTITVIFDSYDHFSTITIIVRQLRSYLMDSYDHVADVWFVSYDHITQVSQAHISKTIAQPNKA